jgi:hypothetical protein
MSLFYSFGKSFRYSLQQIKTAIVLIALLIICLDAASQSFNTNITKITTQFGSVEAPSYSTHFDFGSDNVMKGFWKFSKAYGYAVSFKNYYELTIQPDKSESNTVVKIMGKAEDVSGSCRFYLAVKKEAMPDDVYEELNKTMKPMLLKFKLDFYIEQIDKQITSTTKQAVRISKQYERAKKKKNDSDKQGELMSSLSTINELILEMQQEKAKLAGIEY